MTKIVSNRYRTKNGAPQKLSKGQKKRLRQKEKKRQKKSRGNPFAEVRPNANCGGNGVFALQEMGAMTPVTKYTEVPFTPVAEIPPKFADYTMHAPDGVNCMFGDPAVLPPASHCGYMCNDPHACIFPPGSSLAECRQLATQYVWNHKKEPANLAFIDLKATLGTVRQVSAGEELCIK